MTEIKVRCGLIDDAEFLADCSMAMAMESEGVTLDRARLLAGIRAVFENPGRGEYFIAEVFSAAERGGGGGGGGVPDENAGASSPDLTDGANFAGVHGGGEKDAGWTPAGTLMVTREWSDWHNAWYIWIQSVYVRPEHRRRGVYRALHEHVIELARREGAACVRLYVDRENTAAIETYLNLGMEKSNYEMLEWSGG